MGCAESKPEDRPTSTSNKPTGMGGLSSTMGGSTGANKVQIGYYGIRGRAAPIRYALAFLGVDFEDVFYDRESWQKEKETIDLDFPQIPYIFDGKVHISESEAVIRYIANKWGPALNGSTAEEKIKVDMINS